MEETMTIAPKVTNLTNGVDLYTGPGEGKRNEIFAWAGNDVVIGDNENDSDFVSISGGGPNLGAGLNYELLGYNSSNTSPTYNQKHYDQWGQIGYRFANLGRTSERILFDEHIWGMTGNDTIQGRKGDDWLEGGSGNDSIDGGDDHDALFGDDGADVLITGSGYDYVEGGTGDDTVTNNSAGPGDSMDGGEGTDTLFLTPAVDLQQINYFQFDLASGTSNTTLKAVNFEKLNFSAYGLGTNVVSGADLSDTITGGSKEDILGGFGGDDFIDGAGGADVLNGGAGDDNIRGGAGKDTIYDGDGKDTVYGGGDGDEIRTGRNKDVIFGEGGDDRITEHDADGMGDADYLDGGSGNDWIEGGTGNDVLYGGNTIDSLTSGYDTLLGGDDNDVLAGGEQVDYLDGGAGSDTYYFASHLDSIVFSGQYIAPDLIVSFDDGAGQEDVLDFSSVDANLLVAGNQAFFLDNKNGVVEIGELFFSTFMDVNNAGKTVSLVSADIDGDGKADFGVRFIDVITTLDASDFIL
jgi:Ca2+-binding RTX toxin-like protein